VKLRANPQPAKWRNRARVPGIDTQNKRGTAKTPCREKELFESEIWDSKSQIADI
jgi:hypothetical protein